MSQKSTTDALRARFARELFEFLAAKYDTDVCQTAAGTLMIPTVDDEGEDRWIKLSIIIPKEASEEEGTDGYSLAAEYSAKQAASEARRKEREEKAAAKAAKHKAKPVPEDQTTDFFPF